MNVLTAHGAREGAERILRRFADEALDAADLCEEIDYWRRQRALLQGDLAAADFQDYDEATLRGGINYAETRLAELVRQAERHARARNLPGYPLARPREDLTTRFQAAKYADLVALIETLTNQRAVKGGRRFRIVCPFHADDRDPSLTIYEPGRGWHCFGCGRGGDAVAFVAEFLSCGVVEALRMVEQIADTDPAAWSAAS